MRLDGGPRGHVHVYSSYDPRNPYDGMEGCLHGAEVPRLEVGDSLESEGVTYHALPTLVRSILCVAVDPAGAQVATPMQTEPSGIELTESQLIGAGAGTA